MVRPAVITPRHCGWQGGSTRLSPVRRILTPPPPQQALVCGAPVSDPACPVRDRAKAPDRRSALRWWCQDAPSPGGRISIYRKRGAACLKPQWLRPLTRPGMFPGELCQLRAAEWDTPRSERNGARLVPSRSGHARQQALEYALTNRGSGPAAEWDTPRSDGLAGKLFFHSEKISCRGLAARFPAGDDRLAFQGVVPG